MMDEEDDVRFNEPSEADLAVLANFMPSFSFDEPTESTTIEFTLPYGTEQKEEEEEFDFKLFTATTEKVTIHEPEQEVYEVPVRPMSYYVHTPTLEFLAQIAHSAIDATQVMQMSLVPCPWNVRPHRVTTIVPDSEKLPGDAKKPRWRPSKARRDKFKTLKREEEERQARRAALRAQTFRSGSGMRGGRGRGRGGGGGGGGNAARGRGTTNGKTAQAGQPAGGYPRKGAPPV